jgi:hypothetical protein
LSTSAFSFSIVALAAASRDAASFATTSRRAARARSAAAWASARIASRSCAKPGARALDLGERGGRLAALALRLGQKPLRRRAALFDHGRERAPEESPE